MVVLAQASMARVVKTMPEGTLTIAGVEQPGVSGIAKHAKSWPACGAMASGAREFAYSEWPRGAPLKKRHGVLGLLCIVSVITFLDRLAIPLAEPGIRGELHLSPPSGAGC